MVHDEQPLACWQQPHSGDAGADQDPHFRRAPLSEPGCAGVAGEGTGRRPMVYFLNHEFRIFNGVFFILQHCPPEVKVSIM